MKRVEVTENGSVELRLTAAQGRALAASGIVTAAASPHHPELWTIRSRGTVGVAQVAGMEIWIAPKLLAQVRDIADELVTISPVA